MIDQEFLRRTVSAALKEDLGEGDVTSRAVVPEAAQARGVIVARERLIVAGLPVARAVFREIDPALEFLESCADGDEREKGEPAATVRGSARSILASERTALNFMQRMSGIASAARRCVDAAAGAEVEIADTRKTAPGLRPLDKYAVRLGGGFNHRSGLYDAVLIKDNHWRIAGGVGVAVSRARQNLGRDDGLGSRIEIEVSTLVEVREALEAGADALLLDNMDGSTLERAVELARGRAFLEVSGGVREADIPRLCQLGVDRISIGALTHSVRAADLALELESL